MISRLRTHNIKMDILQLFLVFFASLLSTAERVDRVVQENGMEAVIIQREEKTIFIPGGDVTIGINDPSSKTGEYPPRRGAVKPFIMDKYPVTVRDFMNFKQFKARYKTTAEIVGYSWVFFMRANPSQVVIDYDHKHPHNEKWWVVVQGANWKRSNGLNEETYYLLDHPVTHVSYHDANAYCMAHKKRLPNEFEWEYAARGGLRELRYPWGDHYERHRMNVWQGFFPLDNKKYDGYETTSPVDAYPPQNNYGVYDMVGNVWEWTSTPYHQYPASTKVNHTELVRVENPRMVVKGGSFVDSRDGTINHEARCSARHGYPANYSSEGVGFRCVKSYYSAENPMPKEAPKEPKLHSLKDTMKYKREHGIVDKPKSRLITFYDEIRMALRAMRAAKHIARVKDEM